MPIAPATAFQGCLTRAQTLQPVSGLPNMSTVPATTFRVVSHVHRPSKHAEGSQTCPLPLQQRSGLSYIRTDLATSFRAATHVHCPCNSVQGCLTRAQTLQPVSGLPNMPTAPHTAPPSAPLLITTETFSEPHKIRPGGTPPSAAAATRRGYLMLP